MASSRGRDGLEELFRAEYPSLVRALTIVAADHEAAADAVQDAFLQALRHWRRVALYDDPAAWVRRVALNRLSNQRRSLRRRDHALHRLGGAAHEPEPDARVTGRLDLLAAVKSLPDRQRATVALYYLLGLPTVEIANQMGIGEATVRSHLRDARRALEEHIGARHE